MLWDNHNAPIFVDCSEGSQYLQEWADKAHCISRETAETVAVDVWGEHPGPAWSRGTRFAEGRLHGLTVGVILFIALHLL
jgi:hypothetical protein